MKKILTYIFIFATIGIFITMICLTIADNFIYSLNNSSTIMQNNNNLEEEQVSENIKLPEGVNFAQYSYNNKYYLYLNDGKIYINDTEKKELIDTIEEEDPICFYNLLYDKNLIIYFTEKKDGTTSKLTIKTYEISSKNKMEYNDFSVKNFSRIKELEGSPVINVKYINVEVKDGLKESNVVYRVDLFNNMSPVISGKIISKLVMLKQKDKLYYEDDKGDIYYSGGKLNIFGEKVNLIGTDLDDNLYVISSTNKNKVYKLQNNKIIDTIELSDTNVVSSYSDNTNVYLIYPTYIINISSENVYKRLIKLSDYVTFETIKSTTAYLRTKDNIIIMKKLAEII